MKADTIVNAIKETNNGLLEYLGSGKFLTSVLIAGGIVAVCIFADKLFRLIIRGRNIEGKNLTEGDEAQKLMVIHILSSVTKGIIIALGIIFILQCNGIQVSALITSASIVSAIVGLALQDAIKDIIQGIHIVVDKYFEVGNVIRYGDIDGQVLKISLRVTRIRDIRTNDVITISNRNISTAVKLSHAHDIDIGLSYEDDTKHVFEILTKIAERIAGLDEVESCCFRGIQSFDESSIKYRIRFFSKPEKVPKLHFEAMREIKLGLEEAGIEIPYNQLDVHFDKSPQGVITDEQ